MSDWREQTRDFYGARGIGARGGLGESPAVVVVDMARAFTNPSHPVGSDQVEAIASTNRLLTAARSCNVPVFYTTLAFLEGVRDAVTWGRKMPALADLMVNDLEAMEIDPRIAPEPDDIVFNKRAPSAFFETGFVSLLVPLRVDTLVVTGCATSGCVRATVVDALSYGYRVAIPSDCVADRARGPHEANLFDMDSKYGDVMSGGAVIEYFESLPSTVTCVPERIERKEHPCL